MRPFHGPAQDADAPRRPGDSAHLMPPLGVGANLAMLDGAELAESIATGPGDLDQTVRAFEERMWARAS